MNYFARLKTFLFMAVLLSVASVASAATFTFSKPTVLTSHSGNYTETVTYSVAPAGTPTFTGTNLTFGTATGAGTTWTVTVSTGTGAAAAAAVSDGQGNTGTLTTVAPIYQPSVAVFAASGSPVTVTLSNANAQFQTDTPTLSLAGTAATGSSISGLTYTSQTLLTFTLTPGSTVGNMTITESATGKAVSVCVAPASAITTLPQIGSDYTFTGGPITAGGAGSTVTNAGITDQNGSVYSVNGSNNLVGSPQHGSTSFGPDNGYFNTAGASGQEQGMMVQTVTGTANAIIHKLRFNPATGNGYHFAPSAVSGTILISKVTGGPSSFGISTLFSSSHNWTTNSSDQYRVCTRMSGTNPTYITVAFFDTTKNGGTPTQVTDPNPVAAYIYVDSTSPITTGGYALSHYTTSTTNFSRVALFGVPFGVTSGNYGGYVYTYTSGQTLAVSDAGMTAGTPGSPIFTSSFAPSGAGTSTSIASQVVNSATTATLTLSAGTAPGTLTLSDGTNTTTILVGTPPTLTLGNVTPGTIGPTSISLSVPAATGGRPAYSYQWYRSTSLPVPTTSGFAVSGQTTTTLTDSPPASVNPYYYKLLVTDNENAITGLANSTATAVQGATLASGVAEVWGEFGNSLLVSPYTSSPHTATYFITALQKLAPSRSISQGVSTGGDSMDMNYAVSGTTANYFASGSTPLNNFIAAANAAGVNRVLWVALHNDAKGLAASGPIVTSMQGTIAALQAGLTAPGGLKIYLAMDPAFVPNAPYSSQFSEAALATLFSYRSTVYPNLVGPNVYAIAPGLYNYILQHPSELADGVHSNAVGAATFGQYWANGVAQAEGFIPGATTVKRRVQ